MTQSKNNSISNKILDNGKKNKLQDGDSPIHSWYQFVLGYPPHLVQNYFLKFDIKPDNIVLDPFCGTGTTPVECMKNRIPNYGIEANRMAHFASKVKTDLSINPDDLYNNLGYIHESAKISFKYHSIHDLLPIFADLQTSKNPIKIQDMPSLTLDQIKIIPKGFISERPLQKILILKEIIDSIDDTQIHDFFILSLANLIVNKGGNIGFGPEIYRKSPKVDIDALTYFVTNSTHMIQDLEKYRNVRSITKIINGDSRNIDSCLSTHLKEKIDCIITSPPYPNEKDYTRSTRLESVILGFIKDKKELRMMKENLLRSNSRNIFINDKDGDNIRKFSNIEKIAKEIEEKRIRMNKSSGFEKLYHKIVRHYFGGMYLHLKTLKPFLSPDAKLAYVVGDQMSFFQTFIPTAELLGEIAESLGYEVCKIELWRTRYASVTKLQINENVLVLSN